MAYAVAFDVDISGMTAAGMTEHQKTVVYKEVKLALSEAGFTRHTQDSLYTTDEGQESIGVIMALPNILKKKAPRFCAWVKHFNVFKMEHFSDVTSLISERLTDPELTLTE